MMLFWLSNSLCAQRFGHTFKAIYPIRFLRLIKYYKRISVNTDKYRFGTTKLFLRANVLHRLDGIANKVKMNAILKIQASLRGRVARKAFLQSRQNVITSQAVARSWLARKLHGEMLRRLEGQRMLTRASTKVRKQREELVEAENDALEAGVEVAGMSFVVRS